MLSKQSSATVSLYLILPSFSKSLHAWNLGTEGDQAFQIPTFQWCSFGLVLESQRPATGLRTPKSPKVPGRVLGRVPGKGDCWGDCWEQCRFSAFPKKPASQHCSQQSPQQSSFSRHSSQHSPGTFGDLGVLSPVAGRWDSKTGSWSVLCFFCGRSPRPEFGSQCVEPCENYKNQKWHFRNQAMSEYGFVYGSKLWKCQFSVDSQLRTQLRKQTASKVF